MKDEGRSWELAYKEDRHPADQAITPIYEGSYTVVSISGGSDQAELVPII